MSESSCCKFTRGRTLPTAPVSAGDGGMTWLQVLQDLNVKFLKRRPGLVRDVPASESLLKLAFAPPLRIDAPQVFQKGVPLPRSMLRRASHILAGGGRRNPGRKHH